MSKVKVSVLVDANAEFAPHSVYLTKAVHAILDGKRELEFTVRAAHVVVLQAKLLALFGERVKVDVRF